ncbi:protein of unknown function [Agrobacterium pusense]|uniref:Uncharacterized protein n=1 Tax=Agrobacterium pusense TaxID=648995 RepID=U4Q8F3_9HYPH|nr:protein of unknown function [Agrobacterium pusense]
MRSRTACTHEADRRRHKLLVRHAGLDPASSHGALRREKQVFCDQRIYRAGPRIKSGVTVRGICERAKPFTSTEDIGQGLPTGLTP